MKDYETDSDCDCEVGGDLLAWVGVNHGYHLVNRVDSQGKRKPVDENWLVEHKESIFEGEHSSRRIFQFWNVLKAVLAFCDVDWQVRVDIERNDDDCDYEEEERKEKEPASEERVGKEGLKD